jgi:TetR/AcrR family transcriptional repressor of nem operon
MAYPKGHRDRTRVQIIDSARRLFNRNGFENVSIDAIMADAGLTRGAFYSYFRSKSDLYVEALRCFFTDPNWNNRWRGVKFKLNPPHMAAQIVRAYLSRQHYDDVDGLVGMPEYSVLLTGSPDAATAELGEIYAGQPTFWK